MSINWYPGHMKKTQKLLYENLSLVDVVLEILDARIPLSSRNPQIIDTMKNKKSLIVLNKEDLADRAITEQWKVYYRQSQQKVISIGGFDGKTKPALLQGIMELYEEKKKHMVERGRKPRPARVMVVGIPNVGKSTIINQIAGKSSARTGNKPGVTRGKQWIRVQDNIELLDTPGILWPKFDDERTGYHLAQTGAIRDEIVDRQELALDLLGTLLAWYPHLLIKRFEGDINLSPYEYLAWIAKRRGCLLKHNAPDWERVANLVLDEFRSGSIGRITLERPGEGKVDD